MSTTAPAANTQEAVNSAGSFDAAAESLLEIPGTGTSLYEEGKPAEAPAGDAIKNEGGAPADVDQDAAAAAAGAADAGKGEVKAGDGAKDEWAVDQAALNALLGDPTHGAIVKDLYEKYQKAMGWREFFPTVEEAREARALAPGGLEELKGLVTAAREAKTENAEFASGDPAVQAKVLQGIAADMPEAFAAGAKPYIETLRTASPETFSRISTELAMEGLKTDGVPETLQTLFQALASEDEKAFGESLGKLQKWAESAGFTGKAAAGKPGEQKVSPEMQRVLDENKTLKNQQNEQVLASFNTWKQSLDTTFQKAMNEEIGKLVDGALPKNMPTNARTALVTRLQKEIFAEVESRVNQDTDLGANIAKVIGNFAWRDNGEKTREQVHNLYFGRAKQILPHAAREVLNPFTEAAVAANNAKNEKETQAAGRKDIAAGAPAGTSRRPALSVKDMKGRGAGKQLTDEAILDL